MLLHPARNSGRTVGGSRHRPSTPSTPARACLRAPFQLRRSAGSRKADSNTNGSTVRSSDSCFSASGAAGKLSFNDPRRSVDQPDWWTGHSSPFPLFSVGNFENASIESGLSIVDCTRRKRRENLADIFLQKCCKSHIYSQKSVSIQPRTSSLKIIICKLLLILLISPSYPTQVPLARASARRRAGEKQP